MACIYGIFDIFPYIIFPGWTVSLVFEFLHVVRVSINIAVIVWMQFELNLVTKMTKVCNFSQNFEKFVWEVPKKHFRMDSNFVALHLLAKKWDSESFMLTEVSQVWFLALNFCLYLLIGSKTKIGQTWRKMNVQLIVNDDFHR